MLDLDLMEEGRELVEWRSDVLHGTACFKTTKLPVAFVLGWLIGREISYGRPLANEELVFEFPRLGDEQVGLIRRLAEKQRGIWAEEKARTAEQ